MGQLYRLPRGYKEKVTDTKKVLKDFINSLNKSNKAWDEKLKIIKSSLLTSNFYPDDRQNYVISFDYGIVSSEIIRDVKTGKLSLSDKCVVFIDNTNEFVDNYKW